MVDDFIIRAPIKIRPKLPRGRLHKLCITPEKFEISSWENLYGNNTSEKLFSVPHKHIVEVAFKMPKVRANEGYCKIVYEDEVGRKNSLRFCILGPNAYHQNHITEEVADLLGMLGNSSYSNISFSNQIDISLEPPKNIRKFFYGLLLFSALFISTGRAAGMKGILFAGLFLLFPSLIAVGIDYIRLDTGWSTWIKFVTYFLIFALGFSMLVTVIFFVDYYRIFR